MNRPPQNYRPQFPWMNDQNAWATQATDESGCVVANVPELPELNEYGKYVLDTLGEAALKEKLAGDNFVTRDSGKRHEEPTGACRDSNEGKGRFDLIAPVPLKRLAQLYERGAKKYGEHNWQKGLKLSRYLDSAIRHLNDYKGGDRVEDHVIAAAWNCFSFVATQVMIEEGKLPAYLNDLSEISQPPNDAFLREELQDK